MSWRQVTLADFPIEHAEVRSAWTDTGKGITVGMTKARECARQRLRAERAPLLAAEDLKVSKALVAEDRAAAEAAEAERQRLRDITALPAIDAAKTPEELKGISAVARASCEPRPSVKYTALWAGYTCGGHYFFTSRRRREPPFRGLPGLDTAILNVASHGDFGSLGIEGCAKLPFVSGHFGMGFWPAADGRPLLLYVPSRSD